jgi:hypothetical protein
VRGLNRPFRSSWRGFPPFTFGLALALYSHSHSHSRIQYHIQFPSVSFLFNSRLHLAHCWLQSVWLYVFRRTIVLRLMSPSACALLEALNSTNSFLSDAENPGLPRPLQTRHSKSLPQHKGKHRAAEAKRLICCVAVSVRLGSNQGLLN